MPTAFATILEPFWVVLNRLLCTLQPFEELRRGQADASVSLSVKYTSLPPQLVIWRALRARHIRLAAVCGIAMSASVLAVALSALFEIRIVDLPLITEVTLPYLPHIDSTVAGLFNSESGIYLDHVYVASSNLSNGTTLPPWVSQSMFFLPFELNSESSLRGAHDYKAVTQGFAVHLVCTELDSTGANNSILFDVNPNGGHVNTTISILDANEQQINCFFRGNIDGDANGTKAAELLSVMELESSDATPTLCRNIFLVGFVRGNTIETPPTQASPQITSVTSISSLWMSCRPQLLTAPYSVTVSSSGHILSTTPLAPYVSDSIISTYFTNNEPGATPTALYQCMNLLATPQQDSSWHNDTVASTWFTYLMKSSSNQTAFLDAYAPVPLFEPTAELVSEIYTRLAAIVFGLNFDTFFLPASPPTRISGTIIIPTKRIFMSPIMFVISITLLALNIVVAIWYYACRPKRFLPRMPTRIADLLAMFPASHLLQELAIENGRGGRRKAAGWDVRGWKFGYGRYVGTDGKQHVGIERELFVVPLEED